MKKILFLLLLTNHGLFAQIKGKVTTIKNTPLSYVSVYLEGTLTGTTTNNNGVYKLPISKKGTHTIVFQILGYKTLKKTVRIASFPFILDVQLTNEEIILDEVVVSTAENPATKIMRQVIAAKEKNTSKLAAFSADFYSRGLIKIKNAPKSFLGKTLGDFGGGLDSTRSGIIYLSETISKIKFQQKPKNFKEHITASKVSGSSNGISFNQAKQVYYNLYNNQIKIGEEGIIISPIADYAFSYYNYQLEGTFYNKKGLLINKIKIIPKRKNNPVFNGYIYIVEDFWAIYGADITLTGAQINNPAINSLDIKQNYNFSEEKNTWVQILQTIDFNAGMFGFNVNGRFSATYSNYNFNPNFTSKTFNKEILSFADDATKKDSLYWNTLRPVPLTKEENKDYLIKDSIKQIRSSKKYLDSLDISRNKPSLIAPIIGYTYRNSYKKWNINYQGLLKNFHFNTVQGFNAILNLDYTKKQTDNGKRYTIGGSINYGFSDKRLRPKIYITKQWNNTTKPILQISGGVDAIQFDNRKPISNIHNSIYALIAKENYTKLYDKKFVAITYAKDIANGVRLFSNIEYADRKPLFNITDYSFFNKHKTYQTNNPINTSSNTAPFIAHRIFTASLSARIQFGNTYMSYPNFRFNIANNKYPTLNIGYKKGFGATYNKLNYDFLFARANQKLNTGNLGVFNYNTRAGIFLQEKNIAFIDYYHPLANEIALAPNNRMSSFNLLPYYQFSTNNKYAELHIEQNFKGFLLNKIPLINQLNFHLIGSFKTLFTANRKPYTEYAVGLDNLGWGKWRFLRIDYVRSNFNGQIKEGVVFGVTLFN